MSTKDTDFLKSTLFSPSVVRGLGGRTSTFQSIRGADLTGSNITSTSSFRYDPAGTGLKSSQQVPVDFSKFENHTFFNSAESNVNIAFDKIINGFPFDGNRQELEDFFDNLSGFEKYVYDQFPKSKNFWVYPLNHYIKTEDFAGNIYPTLSRDITGKGVLDPGSSDSMSVEFWVYPRDNQTPSVDAALIQKLSSSNNTSNGFTIGWENQGAVSNFDMYMWVTSGSTALSASVNLNVDEWSHVCAVLNRDPGVNQVQIFKNGVLESTSSVSAEIGQIDFTTSPLSVFSGSAHLFNGSTLLGTVQSPAVDFQELRIWHAARTQEEILKNYNKPVYASDDLKLYYKFNEPTGSYSGNDLILDSSGKSLHGQIFSDINLVTGVGISTDSISIHRLPLFASASTNPMVLEDPQFDPVLFPTQNNVVTLHSLLIQSASQYDANNPNLITNLVPRHYFYEGAFQEGYEDEDGNLTDPIEAAPAFPGGAEFGSTQILSTFLFIWAKYFDELKLFVDQFSKLDHVDYESDENIADTFLPFYAKQLGFQLPNQFTAESLDRYLEAANMLTDPGISSRTVVDLQNLIWRRILTTMKEIIRSRGTQHSVKAFMRSLGLEPNKNFRIREYGGKIKNELRYSTESRVSDIRFLSFSGSLAPVTPTLDAQGFADNKPHFVTNFLSGARIEPGQPLPKGTFVNGQSNDKDDGLFTSSSFTVEGIYRFDPLLTGSHPLTQSLSRLNVTSSISLAGTSLYPAPTPLLNLVAFSPDETVGTTGSIHLYVNEGFGTGTTAKVDVVLNDVNIFDGNNWHVGYKREILTQNSASFSVFANKVGIEFEALNKASDKYLYVSSGINLLFSSIEPVGIKYNSSGSFITIGSQSLPPLFGVGQGVGLIDPTINPDENSRYTDFSGKVSSINFWSKALTDDEIKWHSQDPTSIGVSDPYINFNFETELSGTFERNRLNFVMDQPVTQSDSSGNLTLIDFSQAAVSGTIDRPFDLATVSRLLNFNAQGRGFESSTRVIEKSKIRHVIRTSKFDVNATDNKVRIQTLKDPTLAEDVGAGVYGETEFLRPENPLDDPRFAIEIETVQALDEDIMKIFATMDALDSALGSVETIYHDEYPKLRLLRQIYFNRLVDRVNITAFFEFFRYFDDSITDFVERILPHNTDFLGVNFAIGPHVLERNRYKYLSDDIFLTEDERTLVGDGFGPEKIDVLE